METKIYYESKLKDYAVLFLAIIFTGFFAYLMPETRISFLCIGIIEIIVAYLYKGSSITITADKFIWSKGLKKIECPWSDVVNIHFDNEFTTANLQRGLKGSAFFIETKMGMTSRIDLVSLRVKGHPFTLSKGQELLDLIKSKSTATERTGEVSAFKQTERMTGFVIVLGAIFVVPILIIFIYSLFIGCNIFSSLCV
jgi:hypothetical protein